MLMLNWKNTAAIFLSLMFLGLSGLKAQTTVPADSTGEDPAQERARMKVEVEKFLTIMFKYAEHSDYEKFALKTAYSGADPDRKMADKVNMNNVFEKTDTENLLHLIRYYLRKYGPFTFSNFYDMPGANGKIYVSILNFTGSRKARILTVTVVELNDELLLYEVER